MVAGRIKKSGCALVVSKEKGPADSVDSNMAIHAEARLVDGDVPFEHRVTCRTGRDSDEVEGG